jgi:hypothetical protein
MVRPSRPRLKPLGPSSPWHGSWCRDVRASLLGILTPCGPVVVGAIAEYAGKGF